MFWSQCFEFLCYFLIGIKSFAFHPRRIFQLQNNVFHLLLSGFSLHNRVQINLGLFNVQSQIVYQLLDKSNGQGKNHSFGKVLLTDALLEMTQGSL